MKKIIIGCLLILLLSDCSKPQPPATLPKPALVIQINEKSFAHGMILVGEVRPRYESSQGFRVNGKIIKRNFPYRFNRQNLNSGRFGKTSDITHHCTCFFLNKQLPI